MQTSLIDNTLPNFGCFFFFTKPLALKKNFLKELKFHHSKTSTSVFSFSLGVPILEFILERNLTHTFFLLNVLLGLHHCASNSYNHSWQSKVSNRYRQSGSLTNTQCNCLRCGSLILLNSDSCK